ncbi:MAG TPA: DUF2267 domain-containing protein [Chitinophagaceae bacterium]|nr:DUF2267 domain-containing protein [Chitinophagaceae bacterium]
MLFNKYIQPADLFIKEVANELGNEQDINLALRVTRAVFHTVRDMLTPEESLHLIAQLPMILKAIYVDGWKPGNAGKVRSMQEFLKYLRSKSDRPEIDFVNDDDTIHTVQCMLDVVQRHVTTGEISHIVDQFPQELLVLWKMPEKHR